MARLCHLADLGDLARFPRLERLFVEAQGSLERLRFGAPMQRLAHIRVDECKRFTGIDGLETLTALESLEIRRCAIMPDKSAWNTVPRSVTHQRLLGTGYRKDTVWDAQIARRGYRLDDIFPIAEPGELDHRADPMPVRTIAGF